jgi:hypothetical protein
VVGQGILTIAWRLPRAEEIGVDQVSAISRATPAALLGVAINATIVALSFWGACRPLSCFLSIWSPVSSAPMPAAAGGGTVRGSSNG